MHEPDPMVSSLGQGKLAQKADKLVRENLKALPSKKRGKRLDEIKRRDVVYRGMFKLERYKMKKGKNLQCYTWIQSFKIK